MQLQLRAIARQLQDSVRRTIAVVAEAVAHGHPIRQRAEHDVGHEHRFLAELQRDIRFPLFFDRPRRLRRGADEQRVGSSPSWAVKLSTSVWSLPVPIESRRRHLRHGMGGPRAIEDGLDEHGTAGAILGGDGGDPLGVAALRLVGADGADIGEVAEGNDQRLQTVAERRRPATPQAKGSARPTAPRRRPRGRPAAPPAAARKSPKSAHWRGAAARVSRRG